MYQLSYRKPSLLTRVVGAVAATVVLAASLMVGIAVFFMLLGAAAIAFTVFYVRLRWLRRRAERAAGATYRSRSGQVIEGEYQVEVHRTEHHYQRR